MKNRFLSWPIADNSPQETKMTQKLTTIGHRTSSTMSKANTA